MILLDPRTPNEKRDGPRLEYDDLERHVTALGVPCQRQFLEYGDAAIWGNGPNELPVYVGVEIKKVSEAIDCMQSGRFSGHQLIGMLATFSYRWLVIEGTWRCNRETGLLEVPRGGGWGVPGTATSYSAFSRWLLSIGFTCGIRHWFTYDRRHTAQLLADLHGVVTKPYESHDSHLSLDESDPLQQTIELTRPGLTQRWAKELPGIGRGKSAECAKVFATPLDMAMADVSTWMRVKGVGKKIAEQAYRAIRGVS